MSQRGPSRLMWIGGKDGPRVAKHIADWGDDVAEKESLLEAAYATQLEREGMAVRRQVRIPGVGIADIVTDDAVIEVKLWLTRAALFSAVGQVTVYAAALGKARRVVMGYDTGTPAGLDAAVRAAGVEIVSWIGRGGPDWTDYTLADDYEGPEDAIEEDEADEVEAW